MERYDVYMHNVPKVGPDDKVIPIDPHQTKEFSALEEAQKFAAEHKDTFERITVIHTADEKQKLVERYTDGEHSVGKKDDSN